MYSRAWVLWSCQHPIEKASEDVCNLDVKIWRLIPSMVDDMYFIAAAERTRRLPGGGRHAFPGRPVKFKTSVFRCLTR